MPKEGSLKVYPVVKANAERHFKVAKVLSEVSEYPSAVAHLILGTEELIKALALLLEGKEFNFSTMTDYKKVFYNHSARHSILKEFFSVWIFCKTIIDLKKKKKGEHSILYALRFGASILGGGLEGITNYEWWSGADKLKQNGFYVDYANGVISPDVIGEAAYNKAYKIVMAFRTDARLFISAVSKATEKELAELKASFETADIKKLIEEGIARSVAKK
ncbi:MAG: AbiV family abortive infection protein [Bacteroidetes bacterium]|nr:AbiV family abortive infection protein [Bacteroidota bacterium]